MYSVCYQVDQQGFIYFPKVTICNYNRFVKTRLTNEDLEFMKPLVKLYDYEYATYDEPDDEVDEFWDKEGGASQNDTFFDFGDLFNRAGFWLNESLIWCEWKGRKDKCTAANFTAVVIPEYGLCYTFGRDDDDDDDDDYDDNDDDEIQDLPGAGHGLRMLIDIKQDEYTELFPDGHPEAGVRFVVHGSTQTPLVDTLGFSAAPGFHTYVTLSKSNFEGLPKPWGQCKKSLDEKSTLVYTRSDCVIEKKREFLLKKCKCVPFGYPNNIRSDNICSPKQMASCVGKAMQKYRPEQCECPSGCIETTFKSTISTALFPGSNVVKDVAKKFLTDANSTAEDSTAEEDAEDLATSVNFIRTNWVLLDIYFDELSVTTYKQVEAMTFSDLLADLGGQLGLFLGMSAITAAEILEYLLRKVYSIYAGTRSNNVVKVININT